jgi:hypothetical protein
VCEICEKEEQRIKRLSFDGHRPNNIKLKETSSIGKQREKAEEALKLACG